MMKNKFLLAALTLPMFFAACSQDELISEENAFINKGGDIKVALNVDREGDILMGSRAEWTGGGLAWKPADMISMYWLGNYAITANTALTGHSNAVFKSDAKGENFTSESLVYLGNNAVVYPADVAHVSEKNIEIVVPTSQNDATVDNVPYISNILNIQAEKIAANTPGYHQPVYSPMKMAANVVTLTLDVKNTAALEKYGFDITSVELHANDAFAKKSNLVYNTDNVETTGSFKNDEDQTINTIKHSAWTNVADKASVLTSEAITKNNDGTFDVRFVVMPTDADDINDVENAKIVVNTTCGTITLVSKTETKDGVTTITEGAVVDPNKADDAADKKVTIATALTKFVESITMPTADAYAASKFQGEKVGRTLARTIEVDANKTVLTGSKVYKSEDIIRYVNLYTDMKKTDYMNLVLSIKDAEEAAAWTTGLTAAAVKAINDKNPAAPAAAKITLTAGDEVNAVVLSTVGSVYDVPAYAGKKLPLILSAGNWTMNDTFVANENFSLIRNNGTLTINGTTTEGVQNKMEETVENNGVLEIGGNGILLVNGKFTSTEASKINVKADQIFTFAENIYNKLDATIEVAAGGQLTSAPGVKVVTDAIINNAGIVAAEGIVEGFYNNGIINMTADKAIAYLQSNANGVINLKNRGDEVKVMQEALKGKIVYDYKAEDGNTFYLFETDRFTYVKFVTGDITLNNTVTLLNGKAVKTDIKNISMEFTGTTTLEPNGQEIADLTVAKDAHLQIFSDREITVKNFYLYGQLTIGGTVKYALDYVNEGRILNPGTGTIESQTPLVENLAVNGDTYTINNVAGMMKFAKMVKEGNTFAGKTVKLSADIDLAGIEWTSLNNFRGTFDGNSRTISNLIVEGTENVGLFGFTAGTIQNLTISNANVLGYKSVAAIAGNLYGTVNNCKVLNSTIVAEIYDDELDGDNVAAIAGFCGENGVTITDCEVNNCSIVSNPVKDAAVVAGSVFNGKYTFSNLTLTNNKINGEISNKECNVK